MQHHQQKAQNYKLDQDQDRRISGLSGLEAKNQDYKTANSPLGCEPQLAELIQAIIFNHFMMTYEPSKLGQTDLVFGL